MTWLPCGCAGSERPEFAVCSPPVGRTTPGPGYGEKSGPGGRVREDQRREYVMRKQLDKASKFTRDGRLRTSAQTALDSASPFDTETGELRTNYRATLDNVSKVDRVTGLPKEA